jgi:hypothetical protein
VVKGAEDLLCKCKALSSNPSPTKKGKKKKKSNKLKKKFRIFHFKNFWGVYLFIYSYVHTLFGPSLPPVPCLAINF